MTTGLLVLHPCPPLLRDLLRSLLEPEFEVVESSAWEARGPELSARAPATGTGVHLVVGESGHAPGDAVALAALAPAGTVVVLGHRGEWAVRVREGAIERVIVDLSPEALRTLVRG